MSASRTPIFCGCSSRIASGCYRRTDSRWRRARLPQKITFPNYQEVVRALWNVKSGPGLDVYNRLSVPPEKYLGMPIRTVADFVGFKITTTLESVEETHLADSDFTIPDDYKEVSQGSLQQSLQESIQKGASKQGQRRRRIAVSGVSRPARTAARRFHLGGDSFRPSVVGRGCRA